jgi:hypothetical protein
MKRTREEFCGEVLEWLREFQRANEDIAVPLHYIGRRFGKACMNAFGVRLHAVLQADGRFTLLMGRKGGMTVIAKELTGPSVESIVAADDTLQKLVTLQGEMEARGEALSFDSQAEAWLVKYGTPYPFEDYSKM